MNVTLKPALKKLVDEKLKAGDYGSANELLEAAIARLILDPKREELDEHTLAALKEGEAELDRGEGTPLEAAFDLLRKK
jgi:Arc/MetJ-type ribon-helix-helix transcriptional regulator